MPYCDPSTPKAVNILLAGDKTASCNVQVIAVVEGCALSGGKKYNVINSDGVDLGLFCCTTAVPPLREQSYRAEQHCKHSSCFSN
jgi:hypothetical protein